MDIEYETDADARVAEVRRPRLETRVVREVEIAHRQVLTVHDLVRVHQHTIGLVARHEVVEHDFVIAGGVPVRLHADRLAPPVAEQLARRMRARQDGEGEDGQHVLTAS